MPTWETAADWDAAVSEDNVVHASAANTDYTDASVVQRGVPPSPPVASAVIYYLLQEDSGATVNDLSGQGNDGSLHNSPAQGAEGPFGVSAYNFDGQDDGITAPDPLSNGDDFTFLVVWKPDGTNGRFGLITSVRSNNRCTLYQDAGNWAFDANDGGWNGVSGGTPSTSDYDVVAGTVDQGNQVVLYENGSEVNSFSIGTLADGGNDSLGVGYQFNGDQYHAHGTMALAMVCNSVLSQSTLQDITDIIHGNGELTTAWEDSRL